MNVRTQREIEALVECFSPALENLENKDNKALYGAALEFVKRLAEIDSAKEENLVNKYKVLNLKFSIQVNGEDAVEAKTTSHCLGYTTVSDQVSEKMDQYIEHWSRRHFGDGYSAEVVEVKKLGEFAREYAIEFDSELPRDEENPYARKTEHKTTTVVVGATYEIVV